MPLLPGLSPEGELVEIGGFSCYFPLFRPYSRIMYLVLFWDSVEPHSLTFISSEMMELLWLRYFWKFLMSLYLKGMMSRFNYIRVVNSSILAILPLKMVQQHKKGSKTILTLSELTLYIFTLTIPSYSQWFLLPM